jgi:DNA mismatch repair protein MutS
MSILDDTIDLLDRALDETFLTEKKDLFIRQGYDRTIDEYNQRVNHAHCWLSDYQKEISKQTGLKNIKIKFNTQLGYFIELPKSKEKDLGE